MSDREKNEKMNLSKNPYIREILNVESDAKVKMIYERYRTGKTIIMDDLKYLLMKNPEAFEKIAKHIAQSNSGREFNFGSIEFDTRPNSPKREDDTVVEGNYINFIPSEETQGETIVNISNIMASVKSVIENMSAEELKEISRNVYEPLELIKRIAVLKELEDKSTDEKAMYTYDNEKDFDISV